MRKRTLAVIALVWWFDFTLAEPQYAALSEPDLPRPATEINYSDTGDIRNLVVSEWTDRITVNGNRVYYRYRQGYDYDRKQGFIRVYDLDDNLVKERFDVQIAPGVSKEELLLAFEVFKTDSGIQEIASQAHGSILLHGGFNYAEDVTGSLCANGWRCVHIMAHTDKQHLLLHSVVRLNDRSVVYTDFNSEKPKLSLDN